MQSIWDKGYAQGPAAGGSLFDEYIERRWSDAWLLYANNIRFVSAMAGGGDYGVFEDGRYHLTRAIMDMQDWQQTRDLIMKKR
jgi:hydroxylamine dehydrogenase